MSNPTTPFSWQMPTATDLVTDLPADFEVFGQAVATSMADLLGGTSGQILAKNSNTDMDFIWVAQDDSNAIQNAIVDAKGDLIAATAADTPARLAVGTNGQVLTADSTAATGIKWATPSGGSNLFYAGKNKIINGDFYVNQRGFTSSTTSGTYGFDRFRQSNSGGTATQSAQTFTVGTAPVAGYEGKNYVRLVTASQSAAGDYAGIVQSIEDVRSFAGQTVTVSFWAKASTGTPNVGVGTVQGFGSGGSSNVVTSPAVQAITSSWVRYSFTVAIPSISGKTVGTSSYLDIGIWTSIGTTLSGLGYPAVGVQNVTIDIWGVQVEAGSTATDFQTASGSIQGELALCQRYYNRYTAPQAYSHFAQGWAISTDNMTAWFYLPVEMRTVPTAIDYASVNMGDGVNAQITPSTITFTADNNNTKAIACTGTKSAGGMTQYRGYQFLAAGTTAAYIGFSAEL
jgi:hypothetical protein